MCKINYVDIITTDNDAEIDIKNIDYTKDSLDLILESNKETACSINIYGQTVNNSILLWKNILMIKISRS